MNSFFSLPFLKNNYKLHQCLIAKQNKNNKQKQFLYKDNNNKTNKTKIKNETKYLKK